MSKTADHRIFSADLIVPLYVKVGLQARETADPTWDIVLGPTGDGTTVIKPSLWAVKNNCGWRIRLHFDPRSWRAVAGLSSAPAIRSRRCGHMPPLIIVNSIATACRAIGLKGYSSRSGRRTFIMQAARPVDHAGGSPRDVQLLAGRQSIQVTQHYIDGDIDGRRRLVGRV
jgi:hypothetical protein